MKALLFSIFLPFALHAQMDTIWVTHTPDFEFKDGIYREFRDFRFDAPSLQWSAVVDEHGTPISDPRSFQGKARFRDSTGSFQPFDLDRIWGYTMHGVVHIRAGNGFYRIGIMGSIAHVLLEETVRYAYSIMDPYGPTAYTVESQYILDMDSGALMQFSAASLDKVIARDPVLHEEFRALPARKRGKDEVLFTFLRRYNERWPLLFPQ